MLYKHLFSILCGHLNLNKKRKKFEFYRLPVKPPGKPVKPAGIPVRTISTGEFEFKFAFVRFRPITGLTGPVSRNRTLTVRGDRSENLTLSPWPLVVSWVRIALGWPVGGSSESGSTRSRWYLQEPYERQISVPDLKTNRLCEKIVFFITETVIH